MGGDSALGVAASVIQALLTLYGCAGLGWLGVGVAGEALLRVWTHAGVAVTTREALLPDYARDFERPGFSIRSKPPKAAGKGKQKARAAAA